MLRKLLYSTALLLCAGSLLYAQSEKVGSTPSRYGKQGLAKSEDQSVLRKANPSNQVNALFDIQFNHNLTAARGAGGNAGVTWTGTEFWTSAWASDSMFTLDATGAITSRFKVSGVATTGSGVRALTWDGTNIYAGSNTTTIFQINPTTKTVVSTIASPVAVRGLAYDSTADGGAGGFWVSNYATDISLISRTGTLLNVIPAASHGLTAMYGIAVDNYTSGGPYLWVFDQGTSIGQSDLRRININTQTTDLLIHDVMSDVGAGGSSGLAGGLAIAWGIDTSGARSIIGVLQGTPNDRLFGYELDQYVPPAVEAVAERLNFNPVSTFTPQFLASPIFWDMDVSNQGTDNIDTLSFVLNVDSAGVNVHTDTSRLYNFVSGASNNMSSSAAYTPASKGVYDITGYISTGSQVDEVPSNDTVRYSMVVTDSTLGMDNNIVENTLGLSASAGVLGQKFLVSGNSYASSVTAFFGAPTAGDSVSFNLYSFTTSPGATVLATTYTYIFTAGDAANGVQLDLGFKTAPYQLSAGTYFVGANQFSSTNLISLGYTSFNYQPNACQALFAGSPTWQPLDASFQITFILRLNVLDPLFVGVPNVYKQDVFSVYPNPASSVLTVKTNGKQASAKLSLLDITGREVFTKNAVEENTSIDLRPYSEGVYFVRLLVDGKVYTEKVTISK